MADTEVREVRMIDIRGGNIQIEIATSSSPVLGTRIWINVDDTCLLRVVAASAITLEVDDVLVPFIDRE